MFLPDSDCRLATDTTWTIVVEHWRMECRVREATEGTHVVIEANGRPLYTRTFSSPEEAQGWAEEERIAWTPSR